MTSVKHSAWPLDAVKGYEKGWGDGSFDNVLALQLREPDFNHQNPVQCPVPQHWGGRNRRTPEVH